jgi:hypothetical protein
MSESTNQSVAATPDPLSAAEVEGERREERPHERRGEPVLVVDQ